MANSVPVVTLDGVSGAGKGAVGMQLAQSLAWHYLDSGILYRLLALEATRQNIALHDATALSQLVCTLSPDLCIQKLNDTPRLIVTHQNQEITSLLRTEACGLKAAKVAAHPKVRSALLTLQRHFEKMPGLVADGRDMGQVIFPDAVGKFFLTASVEVRARRRQIQLKQQKNYASLDVIKSAIVKRDTSDQVRLAETLKTIPNACVIDTTCLSINQVTAIIERKLSEIGSYFH